MGSIKEKLRGELDSIREMQDTSRRYVEVVNKGDVEKQVNIGKNYGDVISNTTQHIVQQPPPPPSAENIQKAMNRLGVEKAHARNNTKLWGIFMMISVIAAILAFVWFLDPHDLWFEIMYPSVVSMIALGVIFYGRSWFLEYKRIERLASFMEDDEVEGYRIYVNRLRKKVM